VFCGSGALHEQVATVLFFETEEEANEALLDICLLENHRDERSFAEADLRAMWLHNAALLAAQILALSDPSLAERLGARRAAQAASVLDDESNAAPLSD